MCDVVVEGFGGVVIIQLQGFGKFQDQVIVGQAVVFREQTDEDASDLPV